MKRTINCTAATVALSVCAICHAWNLIQLLRCLTASERALVDVFPSAGLMLAYMAAVCIFNWCSLHSGSRPYRLVALAATVTHLVCALIQGAAVQAMMKGAGEWLRYGLLIPAVINLPMGSVHVIEWGHSLLPWGTAVFFALNLAVLVLRLHVVQENN